MTLLILLSLVAPSYAGVSYVPSAPQPRPSPGASAGEDGSAEEILKARKEMQQAYDSINVSNPFSADPGKALPPGTPAGTGRVAEIQKLLANPAVQGYLGAFNNPAVTGAIQEVAKHPNRNLLLGCEAGLLLFMIIIRAWRQSKATHWARKLWVNFYTFVLGSGLATVGLPAVIIGDSYLTMLKGLAGRFLGK